VCWIHLANNKYQTRALKNTVLTQAMKFLD